LRYEGSDTALEVPVAPPDAMRAAFEDSHRTRFGFAAPETAVIVETAIVEAVGRSHTPSPPASHTPSPLASSEVEKRVSTALDTNGVLIRDQLPPGHKVPGPALIIDPSATTVVEPGWQAEVDPLGNLILTRAVPRAASHAIGTEVDPVMLEIFNNLFMAIAEEMGVALQNTASSVNIKERLDFSCAIFDADGALHPMPPHIRSISVDGRQHPHDHRRPAAVGRDGRGMKPGDAYVLNAPIMAALTLPDITVIIPVFLEGDAARRGRSRRGAHHADVGGIAAGSMPANSVTVDEEGILIDNALLVDAGSFLEAEMRATLAASRWPARDPDRNIADLKAQVAACTRGANELRRIAGEYGRDVVDAYMRHVMANAEEAVRRLIGSLGDGSFTYRMDNGAQVSVAVTVDRETRSARVDFTGTSGQQPNNFNAPYSICRAATLYVFRTLVDDAIPMNDGCLRPIELVVPDGSMLRPHYPAAVVAGNVETSQVITDALFAAVRALAPSQGTMNNFTFGNDRFQYYETIAGGAGAGPTSTARARSRPT
jgi:5-oxoprolinase (ATP-hydrolysing)